MTYTQKISKFRGSEDRIGLSGYVKVTVVLLIYKLKYIVVFDYFSYTLCYIHNGDASTQDGLYFFMDDLGSMNLVLLLVYLAYTYFGKYGS